MRTRLGLTALAVLMAAFALFYPRADAGAPAPFNAEETFKEAEAAVFYLRALREDGTARAVGTGVVIDAKGTAATAYHVVKSAHSLEAVFENGRTVKGIKTLGYNEHTDAAMLMLPAPGKGEAYSYLPVRVEALNYGEAVFAVGYPLKNTVIITEGIVNNPKASINGRDRVLTSAEIVSGMSGGPLIDRQGRLVGIISGSLRTMNNIHLVIDTSDVQELLDESAAKRK